MVNKGRWFRGQRHDFSLGYFTVILGFNCTIPTIVKEASFMMLVFRSLLILDCFMGGLDLSERCVPCPQLQLQASLHVWFQLPAHQGARAQLLQSSCLIWTAAAKADKHLQRDKKGKNTGRTMIVERGSLVAQGF